MTKKLSKTEVKKEIEEFFKNIKDKSPKQIKKIKRLAMKHNIKLGQKRKLFCKKCFSPYKSPKIRIKNQTKKIECGHCGNISRFKINSS